MNQNWTDQQMEVEMGQVLRCGVLLGAAVMLIGGVLYLRAHGATHPQYHQFHAQGPVSMGDILRDAFRWTPRSVIELAVLLLIATPIARVAFAAYAFLRERDWMYTVVSLVVLSLLLFSIFHGV